MIDTYPLRVPVGRGFWTVGILRVEAGLALIAIGYARPLHVVLDGVVREAVLALPHVLEQLGGVQFCPLQRLIRQPASAHPTMQQQLVTFFSSLLFLL